ncbi:hypothetical protein BH20VER2_BH20VER2_09580 [soil metagenome]
MGVALGLTLWTATAPDANAQRMNPTRMIEEHLPQGVTIANASKPDLLSAVCAAVRKYRNAAPQIVRVASEARPQWAGDIVRSAFECLGARDCALLGRVLNAAVSAHPDDAAMLTDIAIQSSPECASSFSGDGKSVRDAGDERDPVGFGLAPLNQNPPPGSVGGGGAQGNVVAVCVNGRTVFASPRGAEDILNNNPSARLGPCVVTPIRNP